MDTLGTTLKINRVKHNLTIPEFVEKYNNEFEININEEMVRSWENNKLDLKIPIGTNIASMYGITRDELVGIKPRKVNEVINDVRVIDEDEITHVNDKMQNFSYEHMILHGSRRDEALISIYNRLSNDNQKLVMDYAISKLFEQGK